MKTFITILLLAACIGLAATLIIFKNRQNDQLNREAETVLNLSNRLTSANEQITGLNEVNVILTNDLAASQEVSSSLSNQLSDADVAITRAQEQAAKAQEQVTNLTQRISGLEAQNRKLEQDAAALTNRMAALDRQIALTEATLAQSQTNNAFLERELKKQVAERTALEQKFGSLAVLRTQYHKLKDEALMAIRLQWMREGTDPSRQVKGAQILVRKTPPPGAAKPAGPPGSLNVEVEAGGAARVVPSAKTNSPAH